MSGGGHGHGGGRRQRGGHEEEHENHERWAVSYADMVTVLMALFIVLFAMSQIDQKKFEQLAQSLSMSFGNGMPSVLDGSDGVQDASIAAANPAPVVPNLGADVANPASLGQGGADGTASGGQTQAENNLAAARSEVQRLEGIQAQIEANLAAAGLQDKVQFRITDEGLVIGLVANDVFFDPSSAELTVGAQQVLDTVAPVLAQIGDDISVQGHANTIPASGRYATNWELSADRAVKVVRRLVEVGGIAADRAEALGFGDSHPTYDYSQAGAMEANRRVDVVVVSGVSEDVRALLPQVAGTKEQ